LVDQLNYGFSRLWLKQGFALAVKNDFFVAFPENDKKDV